MKEFKDLKIAVAGTGYVGLSLAVLLAQHHQVTALDIVPEKVEMINNKKSPIRDEYIEKYLAEKPLDLLNVLVLYRRDALIQFLHFLGYNINGCDVMVLCEQCCNA